MNKSSNLLPKIPACKKRKIEFNFNGGSVSSDAGAIMLRQIDRKINLTSTIASAVQDPRRKKSCDHTWLSMLRQRCYAIALGYEDVNDHTTLRNDLALQTAVNTCEALASASTLSRFENFSSREVNFAISKSIVDAFVQSFDKAPKELILDFDSTDDVVHGNQEGREFCRFYDNYCFQPLYVFCGDQLLVSYLRGGFAQGYDHAGAILRLLVNYLRSFWPDVKIIFRADAGFLNGWILSWCERNNVGYIVGCRRLQPFVRKSEKVFNRAETHFKRTKTKKFHYGSFCHGKKGTWKRDRRILVKAEYDHLLSKSSARYVVTNLKGFTRNLYESVYNQRGNMENRIKEQKLCLFSDRTSCKAWDANQFRLLLSSLAYVLLETIRRKALSQTNLAKAQCSTIRLKLLKLGAVVTRNSRRIKFSSSSAFPNQKIFTDVMTNLSTA